MSGRSRLKQLSFLALLTTAGILPYFMSIERGAASDTNINLVSIPKQIGRWRMTTEKIEVSSFEKRFLNDSLFRCYERDDGKLVALAVAYGADQRQNFSIHVPEGCYRASGFDVTSIGLTRVSGPDIPLKQLYAQKDKAGESIQYWIVLNGEVVTNHFERKFKQFYYSLLGARAGGVLVRVSSLTQPQGGGKEFEIQKEFVSALYGAASSDQRKLLFGEQQVSSSR